MDAWPAGRAPGRYAFNRLPSQQGHASESDAMEANAGGGLAKTGFVPMATGRPLFEARRNNRSMTSRLPLLTTWALVLASVSFWSYRLLHPWVPTRTIAAAPAPVVAPDLTRILGVDEPPPVVAEAVVPADARFHLIGVVSSRQPNAPDAPDASDAADEGVALIAVDGQPAKAYRVGMVVDGDSVLQAVEARGARLGPRGSATGLALNLPPVAEAARGVLPAAGTGGAAAPAAYQPPALPQAVPTQSHASPAAGMVAPVVQAAPAADGTPQAFPGPPQAFGGAPPARRSR